MAKSKPVGRCQTPRCRNQARKGRNFCHKCRSRKWRAAQPMRAAYHNLKSHAKERGIEFRISFAHFASFAKRSELIGQMGRTAESLTVDRRENTKGYIVGNLQVMTRAANTIKHAKFDAVRMRTGFAWRDGK